MLALATLVALAFVFLLVIVGISPASAQTPPDPTPLSIPDSYGGEVVECDSPDPSVVPDPTHVHHECTNNHTHGWWNDLPDVGGTYLRPHQHTGSIVSAESAAYQPRELVPEDTISIDKAVRTGERRCEAPGVRSPHKRAEAWDFLNCEVKRTVEMVVAATVGVSLLGVAWAGIHMISSPDAQGRSRGRQIMWAAIVGLVVGLCCYIFAGMIDLGVNFYVPWGISPQ